MIRDEFGNLQGVEAVVDKDLSSAVLAEALDADFLMVLTDVPHVLRDFGTPEACLEIRMATPGGLRALDFAAGSMIRKVDAACRFVEGDGGVAAIGRLEDAVPILRGEAGTIVTPSGEYDGVPAISTGTVRLRDVASWLGMNTPSDPGRTRHRMDRR